MTTMLTASTSPVLLEVPPSPSNVVTPPETNTTHWVAVDGGLFKECPEDSAIDVWMKSLKVKPGKGITKKRHKPCKTISKKVSALSLEIIPAKKDRSEDHPMLNNLVYVIWPEKEGPTRFYGTVIKYDSTRAKSLYVHYDDGEKWWEPEEDVHYG